MGRDETQTWAEPTRDLIIVMIRVNQRAETPTWAEPTHDIMIVMIQSESAG